MHHDDEVYYQPNLVAASQAGAAGLGAGYEIGSAVADYGIVSRKDIMDFNHKEAKLQRDWQERMWHMQNGYNHPANQKARMIAAGLNPYAEGSVGSIPAGSAGTSSAAQAGVQPAGMDIVNSVLGIMSTMANVKKMNSEVSALDAETQETFTKIEGLLVDIATGRINYDEALVRFRDFMAEREKGYSPTREMRESQDAQQARDLAAANAGNASADESRARISLIESQKEYNEALAQTENELREGRVNEQTARAFLSLLEYNLEKDFGYKTRAMSYEKLKQEVRQSRILFPEELKNIRNENALQDLDKELRKMMNEDFETMTPVERFLLSQGVMFVSDAMSTAAQLKSKR